MKVRHDWLPRPRALAAGRAQTVAILDVGSSKVACLIARLKPQTPDSDLAQRSHAVRVVGFGHQRATGVKRGAIVDMERAERAIRMAVDTAERMAGATIESVIVNISAGRLASEHFTARVSVGGDSVADNDIRRVLETGRANSLQTDRVVLHSLPIAYSLDDASGIRDPRGMVGEELGVDMHLVTAQAVAVRNLVLCTERCHLDVEAVVASPYASGLGAMVADELELGSACIDMGGGTTTFGIFAYGRFVYCDAVAVGGHHVTMDLARGLSTSIAAAERIKVLYGSALGSGADLGDTISVPQVGEGEGETVQEVPLATISDIIRPRVEEVFELVRDRLQATPFAGLAGGRAVLTGGAGQLPGALDLGEKILGLKMRPGQPIGATGLPESARGGAFSAALGLAVYPQFVRYERSEPRSRRSSGEGRGYFAKMSNWIRESF